MQQQRREKEADQSDGDGNVGRDDLKVIDKALRAGNELAVSEQLVEVEVPEIQTE